MDLVDIAGGLSVPVMRERLRPGTQLEIRPLATRTVVTIYVPKSVRQYTQNNGLALMNVCLGSNLEFATKSGALADLVDGRWYGILPDYPAFTNIGGSLVPSPSLSVSPECT